MTVTTRQQRPAYGDGREALLDAAIRVVARKGLRHLTYRAVASEAGVTHGLVAHHFGSRDALLLEALRHSVTRSIDVTELRAEGGSVDEFMTGFAADGRARPRPARIPVRGAPGVAPEHRGASGTPKKLFDSYRSAARQGLHNLGIDDGPLADLVFAALDGLVFQQVTVGSAEVTRDAVEALHRLLAAVRDNSPVAKSSSVRIRSTRNCLNFRQEPGPTGNRAKWAKSHDHTEMRPTNIHTDP